MDRSFHLSEKFLQLLSVRIFIPRLASPRLAFFFVAVITSQAFAVKPVTGEQLEQILAASSSEPDAVMAQQLFEMELVERLSAVRLARCEARTPGPHARQALIALADMSASLAPPAAEIPAIAEPDTEAQRKMIGLTVDYVTKTIHQLPNFYATRVTTSFQDNPWFEIPGLDSLGFKDFLPYKPLHFVASYRATIVYRRGREVVNSEASQSGPIQGLTTSGEFGPVMGTAILDAAQGNLTWSHWEQGDGKPRAVFRFAVPAEKSHYDVSFCCINKANGVRTYFRQFSGYQGEITVDPDKGTVLRLSLKADLKKTDVIAKANIVVEYGPVELGGRVYICPVKAVAVSLAPEVDPSLGPETRNDQRPLQTSLNDVVFDQYHMFHGSVRLLAGASQDSADTQPSSGAGESASPEMNGANGANLARMQNPTSSTGSKLATEQNATLAPVSVAPSPVPPSPVPSLATIDPEISVTTATELPDTPTSSSPDDSFSLRLTARLVDIGVVAENKKGNPLTGLKPEDFEIYDDGRKQTLRFFSRTGDAPAQASAPASLTIPIPSAPQPAYSNRPAATLSGPATNGIESNTTILLIDAGNLAWSDLTKARNEMLDFLHGLSGGERVALYVLQANGFQVLQEGTADHALLATRLTQWVPDARDLARSQEQERLNRQQIDTVTIASGLLSVDGNTPSTPHAAAPVDPQLRDSGGGALAMLVSVARHLAAVPGHKNLAWVTSDNVLVNWHALSSDKDDKNIGPAAIRAQEAMNNAHVTVYPFDASQLETMAVDASLENRNVELSPSVTAPPQPQSGGAQADRVTTEMQRDLHSINGPFVQLATATGGRAHGREGNLTAALNTIVADARSTYLLSFTPDQPSDGEYHLLTVKLTGTQSKGADLRYRTGYLYTKEPVTLKDRVRQALSQPFDVNEIAISINPVTTPLGATLKLNISTNDLSWKQLDDRWLGKLDIFRVQREDVSVHTRVSGQVIDLKLLPTTYQKAVESGLPFDQTVEKEQKTGSIRVIVVDENSGNIGSVTIPATALEGKRR